MRVLLVSAAGEAALGIALLLDPPIVFRLLLAAEASGAGPVVGRVAGIALLCLAVACWPYRGASHRPALLAMLTYDVLVMLYLVALGVGGEWVGPLLWPAAALHVVLAAWCFAALRREGIDPSADHAARPGVGP